MDNSLIPEEKNALIENLLRELPLAPLPRELTADILASVKPIPRSFQITRSDFAIVLVALLCAGAMIFTAQRLPPTVIMEIHKQTILLNRILLINARWLIPSALFGLAALLSVIAIPLWGEKRGIANPFFSIYD